jgi:hypothetical protein
MLTIIHQIIRSFFPWRRHHKQACKGSLQVKVCRQWTNYSCTASVAQMVASHYGIRMNHFRAILLTKCRPDGATLPFVARALRRNHGLCHRRLRTKAQIRSALKKGQPVMTNDEINYVSSHAILLIGQTPKGFWIADPAIGEVYWRHERSFFAGADEFIAVVGPN